MQSISCSIEGISTKRLHAGKPASRLFEIASVLVRLDHITSLIVNADHDIVETRIKVVENEGNRYPERMDISLTNLQEALSIRRQVDTLEKRLTSLLGTASSRSASEAGPQRMSPQARAKIAAAMRARWAKRKGRMAPAKKKGGISAAGRKRLSQLMKARWAARKRAAGKR